MTTTEQNTADFARLGDVDVDLGDLLDVLSNPRRRFTIACLDEYSRPMAMADVAEELASWECDTPTDQLPEEQVQHRYVALYHVHVPKMVDAGIIERCRGENTIALTDSSDGILASHGSLVR